MLTTQASNLYLFRYCCYCCLLIIVWGQLQQQQQQGQQLHQRNEEAFKAFVKELNSQENGIQDRAVNGFSTTKSRGGSSSSSSSHDTKAKQGNADSSDHNQQQQQQLVYMTLPTQGRVQGKRTEGMDFFGKIPYAAPPVGELRFAPPEPPTPWSPAILDGTAFGPDCWQVIDPLHNPNYNTMSEDCLTLNIFTPAGQSSRQHRKLRPVMVWLHGGAFQQGGANRKEYNGRALVERDLIVVTLNYRLGALGFLVSQVDGLYGNFGLMDQRAALDWIASNIQYFGGDPQQVTLFGESAGAVMIGLHLMMEGAGTRLFSRVILQSNPMGYKFRSPTVADFIGEAFKRSVDCRDVACLRAERVEDLIKAQSGLIGMPRSVGDLFTWSPTLTHQRHVTVAFRHGVSSTFQQANYLFREYPVSSQQWANVNVSQPLNHLDKIPSHIPIIIGSNKHEGRLFIYNLFPAPMPKAVYWMFVGALFRESSSRILKHYSPYVEQVEMEAEELASRQIEEEENKHFYLEHKSSLDYEYERLLAMNTTRRTQRRQQEGVQALFETWSRGGALINFTAARSFLFPNRSFRATSEELKSRAERAAYRRELDEQRKKERRKARALKEAAKVVVDYRPVLSRIIDDYLFRCPSWHYAHRLSGLRRETSPVDDNIFVYRFSQPTHIRGYKECWGKSCHTAELPYVFQAMDAIRANYSTVGPAGQEEALEAPEYPYSDIMAAYRGAVEAYESNSWDNDDVGGGFGDDQQGVGDNNNYTRAFQRIVNHFFGDYFTVDADDEIASDMADRWAAFARSGDPNYDGSKADWLPWRFLQERYWSATSMKERQQSFQVEDMGSIFSIDEDDDDDEEDDDDNHDYDDSFRRQEEKFRERALGRLGYEVVEEDVFRTELRATNVGKKDTDLDRAFLTSRFLFRNSLKLEKDKSLSKGAAKQLLRMAQEMNLMGKGLAVPFADRNRGWNEDFFPSILELQWPPEGRSVERDCTCDLWDKIRYRY